MECCCHSSFAFLSVVGIVKAQWGNFCYTKRKITLCKTEIIDGWKIEQKRSSNFELFIFILSSPLEGPEDIPQSHIPCAPCQWRISLLFSLFCISFWLRPFFYVTWGTTGQTWKHISPINQCHATKLGCQVMRLALMSTNRHRFKDKLTCWKGTDANSKLSHRRGGCQGHSNITNKAK